MILIVFILLWRLCAAVQRYLYTYMPTNIAIRWLRTRRGLKWTVPTAFVLTPLYFTAADACTSGLARGGPGWLNLLVVLFIWNGMKFAIMGVLGPLLMMCAIVSKKASARHDRVVRA